MAKLVRRLKRESEKVGPYFNIKKTKIMTTANWQRGSRSSNKLYISGIRSGKGNKKKGGDRKRYNDWIRKVMARQTREHRHKKG